MDTSLQAVFIVLSFLGIIDAGYLTIKHGQKKPLVCPINHNCDVVTESKWSRIFGVRNDALGLVYYGALFGGMLFAIFDRGRFENIPQIFFLLTGGGFLFSLFLVFLQFRVIKDYCFYCMISALLSTLLFIVSSMLAG